MHRGSKTWLFSCLNRRNRRPSSSIGPGSDTRMPVYDFHVETGITASKARRVGLQLSDGILPNSRGCNGAYEKIGSRGSELASCLHGKNSPFIPQPFADRVSSTEQSYEMGPRAWKLHYVGRRSRHGQEIRNARNSCGSRSGI